MNPAAGRRPPRLSPVGGLDGLPPGALPLLARPVPAGFPSPADDYAEGRISLDAHLVRHKEATFFLRVEGDSMRELGILDGDLLVVDRSLDAAPGSVVIAVVDGDFTVKQLGRRPGGGWLLRAANPAYPDIEIAEGKELTIWGVVRWAIHKVWPCGDEACGDDPSRSWTATTSTSPASGSSSPASKGCPSWCSRTTTAAWWRARTR